MSSTSSAPDRTPPVKDLLELVESFPPMTAVGIESTDGGINFHLKPLPPDDRSAVGGLFGFVAPKAWQAVAITVEGRAVPLSDPAPGPDHRPDDDRREAAYSILVTRSGELATSISVGGDDRIRGHWSSDSRPSDAPQGVAVDALHRVMDLPSPGDEPPVVLLSLALWLNSIVAEVEATNSITWDRAVALNLGYPGPTKLSPSVENVAEATIGCSTQTSWERLRRRAARTPGHSSGLGPHELRWMDATMYARWIMAEMPDLDLALTALLVAGHREVGLLVADVVGEVRNRISSGTGPLYQIRIA